MSSTEPMSANADPREQYERLLGFVRRTGQYWWVVAIACVVGAAAGAAYFRLRDIPYESETVMLYSEGAVPTSGDEPTAQEPAHMTAVRLREMLMSRKRLGSLIERFKLYPDIRNEYGMIDAVEEFREHIRFEAPGADTYKIAFSGTSPEQARDVTEALAQSLIERDTRLRQKRAEMNRQFLAGERQRTEEALKDAELGLAEFLAMHPSFAQDSMLLMPGAHLAGAAIRAAKADGAEQASSRRSGHHVLERVKVSTGGDGEQLAVPAELAAQKQRAEADVHAAQSDLSDKSNRYTSEYPDVRAAEARLRRAKNRLERITAAIATALTRQESSSEPTYTTKRVWKPESLPPSEEESHASEDTQSKQLVALETQWSRLLRNVNEARGHHGEIEAAFFKADLAASSETGGKAVLMAIVDPAYVPLREVPPGPITIGGVFALLSIVAGTFFAVGCALVDDRIFGRRDVETVLPVIVAVPGKGS